MHMYLVGTQGHISRGATPTWRGCTPMPAATHRGSLRAREAARSFLDPQKTT